MIRVSKPSKVPSKLAIAGKEATEEIQKLYDKDAGSFLAGKVHFEIKRAIYGHSSIKAILKTAQHNKCCFCEKDQVDEFGAVEHFRPKKAIKIARKDKLKPAGYYWLGYIWDNLFFVCNGCNSTTNKGNLFPLKDEARRAKSHYDDISKEQPLLLDPGGMKDPRRHIHFRDAAPYGITIYGKKTIEICGLDRQALNEKRSRLISDIQARIVLLDRKQSHTKAEIKKAADFLRNAQKTTAEFSSCATDYIAQFKLKLG